jgi:hypothetical protein
MVDNVCMHEARVEELAKRHEQVLKDQEEKTLPDFDENAARS